MELIGNWDEITIRLKQKFGILTNSDLVLREGKYEEMLGKLNLILGNSKEELHKLIAGYSTN